MVKSLIKTLENSKNTLNEVLKPLKSKSQIDQEYYQKNKEKKRLQRKQRYQQQKVQTKKAENEQDSKYYGSESIKILISLKEYTELSKEKRKIWLDFIWTFKDLNKTGFSDIIQIMKICEEAQKLISDYWATAKQEVQKGKSWNSLSEAQQQRLIRYWGYEKVRTENNYLTTAEQLEKQSAEYLTALDLAKFHEERGKKGCPCYDCESKQEIQGEIKAKIKKEIGDYEQENQKEQCPECGRWVKELDEEIGVCKNCVESYE